MYVDLVACIFILVHKNIIIWYHNFWTQEYIWYWSFFFCIIYDYRFGCTCSLLRFVRNWRWKMMMLLCLIVNSIIKNDWKLDLCKFVTFGSDGVSLMVSSHGGITTKLENKINPSLLSYHCVSYWINLAAFDASKALDCKIISNEVDIFLNMILFFPLTCQVSVNMHSTPCKRNSLIL